MGSTPISDTMNKKIMLWYRYNKGEISGAIPNWVWGIDVLIACLIILLVMAVL